MPYILRVPPSTTASTTAPAVPALAVTGPSHTPLISAIGAAALLFGVALLAVAFMLGRWTRQ